MELKLASFVCVFSAVIGLTRSDGYHCSPFTDISNDYSNTVCYHKTCADKISSQIAHELTAAYSYLYMGMHFDQEFVNRPGLAKFLYEAASEERQHAILMLDYLNMRGVPFNDTFHLTQAKLSVPDPLTYKSVLETSLTMEIHVTSLIHHIIEHCVDDFHGADVFTNPILTEQHEGVRKLQGFLKTFDDMSRNSVSDSDVALAEYLFDKKIIA